MKEPLHSAQHFICCMLLLFALLLILYTPILYAEDMTSPLFRLQFGNINIGAKDQSSPNYTLNTTLGQSAAGKFQSTGYIIKAGFQYIRSTAPFRFSISNTAIAFGSLTPNTPATANTILTVNLGKAPAYQVTAVEEGPLRTLTNNAIPDTNCDGNINICSETQAKPWTSSSSYGFGYTISGNDIPQDFINETYYRPFPDANINKQPVVIMSRVAGSEKSRQATLTFKVNISPIQIVGSYQTVVNFVATPGY